MFDSGGGSGVATVQRLVPPPATRTALPAWSPLRFFFHLVSFPMFPGAVPALL